jgi:hypothetical protein
MRARLFDAHNRFLQEYDVSEASSTLKLPRSILGQDPEGQKETTFTLLDTDDTGALIYREVEESPVAVQKPTELNIPPGT